MTEGGMTWETAVKPRRGRLNAHGSKVVGAQKRKPVDEIGFRADGRQVNVPCSGTFISWARKNSLFLLSEGGSFS